MEDNMDPVKRAIAKYEEFQRWEYRGISPFHKTFRIPKRATYVGDAVEVLYSSYKIDPETGKPPPRGKQNYIHEHTYGAKTYIPHGADNDSSVPPFCSRAKCLVYLGQCLGFAYSLGGRRTEIRQQRGSVLEVFCTDNGKALIYVQDRRFTVGMTWGGSLDVQGRGIVG